MSLTSERSWQHSGTVAISCGIGAIDELGAACKSATTVLIVTSRGFTSRGITQRLLEILSDKTIEVIDSITPNPEVEFLDPIAYRHANSAPDCIVALGGGSAIDAGKILSVAIPLGHQKTPIANALNSEQPQSWDATIPVMAIPTTAGTGAEVTPFATIWDARKKLKYSVAGGAVQPKQAIADPSLTVSLPRRETLHTGLDTISHALESLWNNNRTPISESYAIAALARSNQAFLAVLDSPSNLQARQKMQEASLLAGLAISQTKTAMAHSISYPLTSHYHVPHGLACSFTLVEILRQYLTKIEADSGAHATLMQTHALLHSLDLQSEIARYVSHTQIEALKAEMITPGRANNLSFALEGGLDSVLRRSTTDEVTR